MAINSVLRAYPELHLEQYLKASGRAKVAATAGDCLFEAVPRYPFLKVADIESVPHALDTPAVADMLDSNSPLYRPGVPQVPTYWYHTRGDEFAPFAPALATIRKFCAGGTVVQAAIKVLGEHLTEIALGASGAMTFLANRFAGRAPVDSCASLG
jgi:hypothetical protein